MSGGATNMLLRIGAGLTDAVDLDALLTTALATLDDVLGLEHSMLLIPHGRLLSVLACRGYSGGVGAEIAIGSGVPGIAADRLRPVRINHVQRELGIVRSAAGDRPALRPAREIQMPGLEGAQSQIAVPVVRRGHLIAVIFAESVAPGAFSVVEEEVVCGVAHLLSFAMGGEYGHETAPQGRSTPSSNLEPITVRRFESDDSVFIDNAYVIKSLPGRILWKLFTEHHENQRSEFTNKELRVDARLKLPPIKDNLETRLILLRRRLAERFDDIRIIKIGRGRFRFEVDRPISSLSVVPE